jgi:hypothetical protein
MVTAMLPDLSLSNGQLAPNARRAGRRQKTKDRRNVDCLGFVQVVALRTSFAVPPGRERRCYATDRLHL